MAEKSIEQEIYRVAHSINPLAPEHDFNVIASVHYADGRCEVIRRCNKCPLETWGPR